GWPERGKGEPAVGQQEGRRDDPHHGIAKQRLRQGTVGGGTCLARGEIAPDCPASGTRLKHSRQGASRAAQQKEENEERRARRGVLAGIGGQRSADRDQKDRRPPKPRAPSSPRSFPT